MKTVCVIQARLGSKRLPGKVMMNLGGKPVWQWVYDQLKKAKHIDQVVFALADEPSVMVMAEKLQDATIDYMIGPSDDVLERYYLASQLFEADIVVRITCDCPLSNPQMVDQLIYLKEHSQFDYVSNIDPPTFPNGLDVEVFSQDVLRKLKDKRLTDYDREHVTPKVRQCSDFTRLSVSQNINQSHLRITLDTPSDFVFLTSLIRAYPDINNLDLKTLCDVVDKYSNHMEVVGS